MADLDVLPDKSLRIEALEQQFNAEKKNFEDAPDEYAKQTANSRMSALSLELVEAYRELRANPVQSASAHVKKWGQLSYRARLTSVLAGCAIAASVIIYGHVTGNLGWCIFFVFMLAAFGKSILEPPERSQTPTKFTDVDKEKKQSAGQSTPSEGDPPVPAPAAVPSGPFAQYFFQMVGTLEAKADAADKKASILLDKGTLYSRLGIVFYAACIVLWQGLTWSFEFRPQMIYGIVACSFLFAFIEFLSAWFLRQYRHFVDTSTYLLKVKAILDRYYLAYLAGTTPSPAGTPIDPKSLATLNALLKEPIRWPEYKFFDKGTENFASEAVDSVAQLSPRSQISGRKAPKGKSDAKPNSGEAD